MPELPCAFRPRPEYVHEILKDIKDPAIPLQHVADRLGTSLESLCIWLTEPHIIELLDKYECACSRRVSLIIADKLPRLIEMVSAIIENVHAEEKRLATEAPSPRTIELRRSARKLALNGIRLLTRFSRLKPASTFTGTAPRTGAARHRGTAPGVHPPKS